MKRVCKHSMDLSGYRVGRVTVLGRELCRDRHWHWYCECSCGKKFVASTGWINNKMHKSCGCHRKNPLTDEEYGNKYVYREVEGTRLIRVAGSEKVEDNSNG